MSKEQAIKELAVNGGEKAIDFSFPGRFQFGEEEKNVAMRLFDNSIESGNAFGYNGPEEDDYCAKFAEFMGGGFADGVNSGTNSVYTALKALNPEPFSEIIVGCVTDPGGIMPIPLLNCIPIVADAAPGCYNSGAEQIEELITPLTSVIVVAHIGGEPADMPAIMEVAKKHNIPVLEDCSQSHGVKINGQCVGTFGDIAAFSTMFGKHHCAGGQGGIVYTKNEELYWKVRSVADRGKPFGMDPGHTNCVASLNNNLNELAGAIGAVQITKLPEIIKRRQVVAEKLRVELANLDSITIPDVIPGGEHVYWWYRLEVNTDQINVSKDEYCKALTEEGVLLNPYYGGALPHTMEWFKNKSVFGTSQLPWSSNEYKGDASREFSCPNALASMGKQFNLNISESWEDKEIQGILNAFIKVDAAFGNSM